MTGRAPAHVPRVPSGGIPTRALLLACVAASLAGCAPAAPSPSAAQSQPPALSAPSLTPDARAAVDALETALRAAGFGFVPAATPYRPSEPEELLAVPRVVYQEVLPQDPGAGYVVIYELPDAETAQARGHDLARYLASGFGQTAFPIDARFAVTTRGATLLFSVWSPGASADPAPAGAAFDIVARVGEPIPVVR